MNSFAPAASVTLLPGRDKAVLNGHPWIFSGGLSAKPQCEDGSIIEVRSDANKFLALGYYNSRTSIAVRVLSREPGEIGKIVNARLSAAFAARTKLFAREKTNAYRLVNGEGDFLPGLIIDRYEDVIVVQIGTKGMDVLYPLIEAWLIQNLAPRSIIERSDSSSRKEEGLDAANLVRYGEAVSTHVVLERGLKFLVNVESGQKTGFFLDQRDMRSWIGERASNQNVLNLFSFSGGFSVHAAKGGATRVISVDSSAEAIELAKENFRLNEIPLEMHGFETADVFDYLSANKDRMEIVIVDPPAFAKQRSQINQACRGYQELNKKGFAVTARGGLMTTCSCSHYVDEKLFQQVVFQAAVLAGRQATIVQRHLLAEDHPVSLHHPEGAYLKSLTLRLA